MVGLSAQPDDEGIVPPRGIASTTITSALCKDCARRVAQGKDQDSSKASGRANGEPKRNRFKGSVGDHSPVFDYPEQWAEDARERGQSRSDRCPECRSRHRSVIRSLAVAYIDVETIGEVADRQSPTGALGGLGPLPGVHESREHVTDLANLQFGLTDAHINELLEALTVKRVAVLVAGTGTGKSTFGPFRLMNPPADAPLRLTDLGQIVVTEPRILATKRCATFVAEQLCLNHDPRSCRRHIGPGYPVGYRTSEESRFDDGCQLVYVTDGTLLNWIKDGRLGQIGTVIVDEAHERSVNIDLIISLIKHELDRHPHLRFIITSATMDPRFWEQYFGGPDRVHVQEVPPVKLVGYGEPLWPDSAGGTSSIWRTDFKAWLEGGWPEQWFSLGGDEEDENLWATTCALSELRFDRVVGPEPDGSVFWTSTIDGEPTFDAIDYQARARDSLGHRDAGRSRGAGRARGSTEPSAVTSSPFSQLNDELTKPLPQYDAGCQRRTFSSSWRSPRRASRMRWRRTARRQRTAG